MPNNETEHKANQETVEIETENKEAAKEEQVVQEAEQAPKAPEPTATGNKTIAILKHDIYRKDSDEATEEVSIRLSFKNISDYLVGSAIFEAELYDIDGNVLDKVEQKTNDLKPGVSRTICINYSDAKSDKVRSYCARVAKIVLTPESSVTGNEKVKIIKHSLNKGMTGDHRGVMAGTDITIKNVSDITISSLLFEAVFYDIEGNVLDTVRHKEMDIKPNASRIFNINYSKHEPFQFRRYDVKIVGLKTVEDEKIQLRGHDMITTATGEKEVKGVVKNMSGVKADAALVATFLDGKKENIGTKVIILRDIEPHGLKQFHFTFKPMEGDKVRRYTLNIGDLVEETGNK